ncbi:hypothetical protein [Geotalea sp. SG265]|uniref:hypothetical protein n=1 Tax=Geotalea sp. SG265 TaxID=2922867 RepID=UPI001FAFD960|nr:hypothetical protein [Geotalea sp. SG265]
MKLSQIRSRTIALFMLTASIVIYGADYFIAGNLRDVYLGFLGNFAFLPIYVLFVTLMIERVLREREREALRQKLNMVIGVFFSEVGTALISDCFSFIREPDELSRRVRFTTKWTRKDFAQVRDFLLRHEIQLDSFKGDLISLKSFLLEKKGFMLGLLENPNLLEHDEFTDLLWAVFHLIEELEARSSLTGLPKTDLEHLSGDIKRAYNHLLREWVVYMEHLQRDYPYLFSLAVRTNPLDPEARVEIL